MTGSHGLAQVKEEEAIIVIRRGAELRRIVPEAKPKAA
jgi:hypothetical protein